jgi:hypothetical protein
MIDGKLIIDIKEQAIVGANKSFGFIYLSNIYDWNIY